MKIGGALEVITGLNTFNSRFDELMDESFKSGGTANGVNMEIEYWANFFDALAYTVTDKLAGEVANKFLKDYFDLLGESENVADFSGDNVGTFLKEKWYLDEVKFQKTIDTLNTEITDLVGEKLSPDVDNNGTPDNNETSGDNAPSIAPLDPPRHDPLALDMDKDGFIDTYSLANSSAFFDITGDGIREKVGWIKDNDALLVYDKNENSRIDGIGEVFGNMTKSGFT